MPERKKNSGQGQAVREDRELRVRDPSLAKTSHAAARLFEKTSPKKNALG